LAPPRDSIPMRTIRTRGLLLALSLLFMQAHADSDPDREQGKRIFDGSCARCHDFEGFGGIGPGLHRSDIVKSGNEARFARLIREGVPDRGMPPTPGLGERELAGLMAYVRGLAASSAAASATPVARRPVNVSYQRLLAADETPSDWLTYSGAYHSQRFSRLEQINKGNVARLRPEWTFQARRGGLIETSPIVADGVMFITEPPSTVTALDVRTGRELWSWTPEMPKEVWVPSLF